ncbi:MAG TPA: glutamine synthetase family protein [Acidimicrobiales bacterium]|nr:glutamine synthetase family protein [Acidimicrobiales bacterium]
MTSPTKRPALHDLGEKPAASALTARSSSTRAAPHSGPEGIRLLQLEIPDLDGALRAKLVHPEKGLSPSGSAMCTIMFGLTTADDVFETPASSADNGYPDLVVRADPSTIRTLPWCRATAAAIGDLLGPTGALYPLAPRSVLRHVEERCVALGYEARFAAEYELCIVHRDDALSAAGRHGELNPLGRTMNAYSSLRLNELRPLAEEFVDRMDAVDIPVEAVHTELGQGMVEFALSHSTPVVAADRAARAKTYLKELCAQHDLVATFMSKWRTGAPTSGCHFHQSLWSDGDNAFAADDGGLTDLCRHYLAGQLATMADFGALFNPTVNSYRRLQPGTFTPATASWGVDNRTAALRAITGPRKAVRVEHRRPGADTNPYLAIAAMLAGGLHGIERSLDAPPPTTGDAYDDSHYRRLPTSLDGAVSELRESALARELLGTEFVEHYLLSRVTELQLWHRWAADEVTEWEHRRYFETI